MNKNSVSVRGNGSLITSLLMSLKLKVRTINSFKIASEMVLVSRTIGLF